MASTLINDAKVYNQGFMTYLNEAYSVFHASENACNLLLNKGFQRLKENENWNLQPGKKYFFQRNATAVMAFMIGDNFKAEESGFKIACSHLDSPCLQLAPVSKLQQAGFNQACIQTYGGGNWYSWMDRDLLLGGKVIYQDTNTKQYITKLWNSKKPLMKVDSLAIHLMTSANKTINTETQLRPIISTEGYVEQLNKLSLENTSSTVKNDAMPTYDKHYDKLIDLICTDLAINKEQIVDMEIQLCDSEHAGLTGATEEFLSAHKIDDLICTYAAVKAFQDCDTTNKKFIDIIALFDHEEIGSLSNHGAKSCFLNDTMHRIFKSLTSKNNIELYEQAKARSFIVSADVGHSIHPNYIDRYQINHYCWMNKGLITSFDPGQDFASSIMARSIIYELGKLADVPVQDSIKQNNQRTGSTVGPPLTSLTSVRTADIGPGLLGMHSIRETAGVLDTYYSYKFLKGFFDKYETIDVDSLINN